MKKKRGMEEGSERSFSDPRFFFHTIIVSVFSPSPSCFHILLSSNTPLYPVFPSQPFIDTSILHHSKSHLLYSFHLPFVPFFFFFFAFGMVRDVLPVIPPLYHLSHPVPERERGGAERRGGRKRKRGAGVGGGG